MATKSIGIDIREAWEENAGKGRYSLEITKALLEQAPADVEFVLFTHKTNRHFPASGRVAQIVVSGKSIFWHLNLRRYLKNRPVDWFLAPTSYIYPAIAPKNQNVAVVVHDLISFLYSKTHAFFPTMVERLTLGRAIKKSRLLVCVSQHTAHDLSLLFPGAHSKNVLIASPGISPEIHRVNSEKMDLPQRYILGVGTQNPRKNFSALIQAFSQISERNPDLHVVIAGGKGWKTASLMKNIPNTVKEKIHFLGYVNGEQLNELYSRALMLVFPSLYEGFGIPPLEAMACSCPVVASNRTSIPEVVGDAALLVDPQNISQLARAMQSMLGSKTREVYKRRGSRRAQLFTWKQSAKSLLEVFIA